MNGPRWRGRAGAGPLVLSILALCVIGDASTLGAQGRSDGVEFEVQGLATVYDNFFRVGEDMPENRVLAWTTLGRVTVRPDSGSSFEVFGEAQQNFFETLGQSYGLGGGVRLGRNPHRVRFQARYLEDWPAWDVGDRVQTADVLNTFGSYTYRLSSDWVVGANALARFVKFTDGTGESQVVGLTGRVRYRGLTYRFQPEVGAELEWRFGDDPNLMEQRDRLYAAIVVMPVDALWMNVRYRYRTRSFPDADTTSVNFQRADDGAQWTVDASFTVSPLLHFTARYNRIVLESSVPRHGYSAQILTLGTILRF